MITAKRKRSNFRPSTAGEHRVHDWFYASHGNNLNRKSVNPLTLLLPIPLRLYTLPYWSNPEFLIFDIRALCRSQMSARVPECQKLKTVG